MPKHTLIYSGRGAGSTGVTLLEKTLADAGVENCKRVRHTHILGDDWETTTHMLIMPEGRDTPYHDALQGEGNKRIRSFVERGGTYLGICAGAYYGCAAIVFEKDTPLEVIATRELAFYRGTAHGPAYGSGEFSYTTNSGSRIAYLSMANGARSASFYKGGCCFPDADADPNVEVIARYADLPETPAAIISCQVGKGRAILCGVHPEYTSAHLPASHHHYVPLQAIEGLRKPLFEQLISST